MEEEYINPEYNFNYMNNIGWGIDGKMIIMNVIKRGDDFYTCIMKNGIVDGEYFRDYEDLIITRISILEPRYLESDELLTRKEIKFINYEMHIYWDSVIDTLDLMYNLKLDIQCPDYNLLPAMEGPDKYINIVPDNIEYHGGGNKEDYIYYAIDTHMPIVNIIRKENELYTCVLKNKDKDLIIFRISLLDSRYVESDEKFSKEELNNFNTAMHNLWDIVVEKVDMMYDIKLGECPDYSILETRN